MHSPTLLHPGPPELGKAVFGVVGGLYQFSSSEKGQE